MAKEFYEVVYTSLDGNVIGRDVKHFTDEREAIAFHNSLKDNDMIASAIIDKVYYDPKSFLSGRTEIVYYANPIHKDYLNSREGDKRFEEPEPIMKFLKRKLQARKEFGTSLALNEFDDKSMKDYGDAMKVILGSKKIDSLEDRAQKRFDRLSKDDQTKLMKLKAMIDRERDMEESNLKGIREEDDEKGIREEDKLKGIREEDDERGIREEDKPKGIREEDDEKGIREETSIERIYMDMLKNELPSQDEVNDAFEKFEREAHYLNNKPVGEWDAMDMSNWKSILRKGGRVMENMVKYRVSHTKKDSSKSSIDFIGGLNAEDEFYELMDDDNIISAKVEYIGGDEVKVTDTWSRDKDGKVSFGGKKSEFSRLFDK